jgi:hypothetical protein
MRIGAFHFNPDYGIGIGELARELETRGFASLYVPEHTHIPTSRRTPFPHGGKIHHEHPPPTALEQARRPAQATGPLTFRRLFSHDKVTLWRRRRRGDPVES